MAKHIQLTIADPCHEDWDSMSPTARGRFCGSCQKQVVDFTGMSDAQLVAFFKKKSTGSVCGRFFNDQLDKDISIPRKRIPWIKYFFQLTLPLFLTSLKSNAQKGKVAIRETETVCLQATAGLVRPEIKSEPKINRNAREINGIVSSEDGKPVPYASIMLKGAMSGNSADSSGAFTIELPEKIKNISLLISSVGFETKEIVITAQDIKDERTLNIQLRPKTQLPEVVFVSYSTTTGKITLTGATSVIVKSMNIPEDKKIVPSVMKLYPNPVAAGTTINIACAKMEESYYSFQFLNLAGQLIIQKEIWIDKEAGVFNMPIPPVAAGTYFVRLVNKKSGKSFTDKLVIQ